MTRPTLELDLSHTGHGKVALNGHEIPWTTAVSIDARVGEPTRVKLEIIAPELRVKLDGFRLDPGAREALRWATEVSS